MKEFIHKLDSKTLALTKESISKEERIELIKKLNKYPGEQNLDERIFLAQVEGNKFLKTGSYDADLVKRSKDWIAYWNKQKELCYTGLLIDEEFYISGDAYFYLNYCIISFKSGEVQCPEIRDSDIWFFQLIELADLQGKFTVCSKRRQWGYSLKMVAKLTKRFIFEKRFSGKIVAPDEKYVKSGWSEITSFRDHVHKHTAWKRPIMGAKLGWTQGQLLGDGTIHGLESQLKGITTKNNPKAVVSGKTDEAFFDESGLDRNLLESIGYLKAALMDGNIVYGSLHVGGAAGNVKDSEDLKELFYNPDTHNMLSVPNIWDEKPDTKVGIFIPAYYSFGNCKDEFGNSKIEEAKKALEELGEIEKKKSFRDYMLFRSQNPVTTTDMFASREDNIYPVHIIQPYYDRLSEFYKPTKVEIYKGRDGMTHTFKTKYPILEDFPVNKNSNKHGCVVIEEAPVPNPPFGLYYAGVDTITPIKTTSSISVQAIYIYKAAHELNGEFNQEKIVAWYAGRPEDPYDAFRITRDLIQYYNARALIENNNRNFIEWMINEKQQKYMMKRSEVPIGKDLIMNSGVDRSDYGINASRLKDYLSSLGIDYVSEVIETKFDEEGKPYDVYGVERVPDRMLLTEMLEYTPKKNVDRCFVKGMDIYTNKGIKPIENINISDLVLTGKGTYEKVMSISANHYKGNGIKLRVLGTEEDIICTSEHPFLTAWSTTPTGKKPYGKYWHHKWNLNNKKWKKAENIKQGDYLLIPKRKKLNKSDLTWFEQYLLGWYLSDGYISTNNNKIGRVRITFHITQKHIAKFIINELMNWDIDMEAPNEYKVKVSESYNIEFTSKKFRQILDKCTYIYTSKGNLYKTLKLDFFQCNNLLPLILGFLEGDGHQKMTNYNNTIRNTLEVSSINKILIYQLRQILIDNDIWCTINLNKGNFRKAKSDTPSIIKGSPVLNGKIQYRIDIQDWKGINRIVEKSKKFTKIDLFRKQKKHHICKKEGIWIPVKKVENIILDEPVYNFEVEKEHTYTVKGLVTHNCDAFQLALLAAKTSTGRGLIVSDSRKSDKNRVNYTRRNVFNKQKRIKNPFI